MFQHIIDASLRQRLFVLAACVLLLGYGALSLRQLPVDVLPDLNKPTVTVMTEAGGMAPEEVEPLVTFPIESAMSGLPGVTRVRSVSSSGLSIVYVEFNWDTDIYLNRQQVAERLAVVKEHLPPGVSAQLGPITSIMGEIMLVGLEASAQSVDSMALRDLADFVIRPRLLTLPGVSQVIAIGGQVKQYQVHLDPERMRRLKVTLADIERALTDFSANTTGGFFEQTAYEYVIRHLSRTTRIEDLAGLTVTEHQGRPITLAQVAEVGLGAKVKRGDASVMGRPAVILSVQKQPGSDTVELTRAVEAAFADLGKSLPHGTRITYLFKQANFIESALDNLRDALWHAAVIVTLVLFMFLLNLRTTFISLAAIPISAFITVLAFRYFGLSINSMTLGGLAIAIGELVDDAVVGVENVFRRLKQNRALAHPRTTLAVIGKATLEVRSGIYYATLIIVLVFVPLFALTGIEGRLFAPLGIAYIVSIVASMLVSMTLTPVLCYYLLPNLKQLEHGDGFLLAALKRWDAAVLSWSFRRERLLLGVALLLVFAAVAAVPALPRAFLPAFNEGTLTVNVILNPGSSLSASNEIGTLAERLLMEIPEVTHVGRRTGRAEMDEHAEGVHYSEIDVDLKPGVRSRSEIVADIRARLSVLPAVISLGQPISHRLDHLLSGVRAQISLKIFGDDLAVLRTLADAAYQRMQTVPGLVDVQVEKQVLAPQLQVRLDYQRAAAYGITPGAVTAALQTLASGRVVSQVIEGNRRHDVVIRLPESTRTPAGLAELLIEAPQGPIPLNKIADIVETEGPNQVGHDNGRRRIVVSANHTGGDLNASIAAMRAALDEIKLPEGYFFSLEGEYAAQEEATRLIGGLALISLLLIVVVLYSRYRSLTLTAIILFNVPLALVGSVVALVLAGLPLSVASLVGFITLAGISTRNGILKISHYINLVMHEGEVFGDAMIVRGSLERLAPVLMTATVAALALLPLMMSGEAPGKEILHPVAVVIFGGLMSSTLLDTLLTPVMFRRYGKKALDKLLSAQDKAASF